MTFLLSLSMLANAAPKAELWSIWNRSNESSSEVIDHSLWQQVLDKYLQANHSSGVNRFDYGAVNGEGEELLSDYLDYLQELDPREYSRAEQKAYWINFYNALTIQRMLEAYPVKSILKVGGGLFTWGPWDDALAEVAGEELTLNDIEHRILRPIWNDPRLHFAVNCASIGCPNLQARAFTAENSEQLLALGAKEYLSHKRGAHFDNKGRLVLSKIFEWYGVDFGDSERAIIQALSQYAPDDLAQRMREHRGKVKYEYDWDLNKP
ncbi:DUF547 domain-containing protein [Porticoccus sp. W117]|uniref:DUF547 domain-containing protein n=1 Tax=Porticoccus sp. W117 TaxID=3054777 RepID=UPI0025919328|nr:DUF547 domain-containing protein [Porticoccus sp. W117]MDM3871302.1 DUF547 domain-containing protein [Porticoccus sp. W117]